MKIAGVVNDYNYAVEIEEIVKAFIIKQRISALFSLDNNKKSIKNNQNLKTLNGHRHRRITVVEHLQMLAMK
jgi:hypothetical protein